MVSPMGGSGCICGPHGRAGGCERTTVGDKSQVARISPRAGESTVAAVATTHFAAATPVAAGAQER